MGSLSQTNSTKMPVFPLVFAPLCKNLSCKKECEKKQQNGSNREYYKCTTCGAWCTWNDDGGVTAENDLCHCGYYSRVQQNSKDGSSFWSCAIGQCNFRRNDSQTPRSPLISWATPVAITPSSAYPSPKSPPRAQTPEVDYEFVRLLNHVKEKAEEAKFPEQQEAQTTNMATRVTVSPSDPRTPSRSPSRKPFRETLRAYLREHSEALSPDTPSRQPKRMFKPEPESDLLDIHTSPSRPAKRRLFRPELGPAAPLYTSKTPSNPQLQSQFKISWSNDSERQLKVGAAGELYMFHFLRHFLKDQVSWEHWKSNKRELAKQYPDFKSWLTWDETEAADIEFPDDSGDLTALLINNGYLDSNKWKNVKPEYLIEVDTALSGKNKEFYMTNDQYERMKEYTESAPSSPCRPKIYMIARVSNLQESNIDLQLYIDPEHLKSNGTLKFSQVWVIKEAED